MSKQKRQKIIDKINSMRKITKDRGATEAEALNALNMVSKLLEEYNINMNEIDIDESSCKWYEYPLKSKKEHIIVNISGAISELTGTKAVLNKDYFGNLSIKFFGMEQDIIAAGFMAEVIHKTIDSEYKKFFKEYKKTDEYKFRKLLHINNVRKSFHTGCALRVMERIRDIINESKENIKNNTGTSLVLVKDAVVQEEFEKMVGDIKTHKHKHGEIKCGTAMRSGYDAGENIPLNKGISENLQKEGV